MKLNMHTLLRSAAFACALFTASLALAQQNQSSAHQRNDLYSQARETALQGTVVSYTPGDSAPVPGPHVVVQTAAGTVDVHLGNEKLLEFHHFSLNPGDSVRIVGETVAFGAAEQFVARTIQKGGQSLTLRSVRGFPLRPVIGNSANRQGGVQ